MGIFSRTPVQCPMCSTIDFGRTDRTGFGHFATHLDDLSGDRLGLACGHADAAWSIHENFPDGVMRHLREQHRLKV